ncbi:THO complex subunit 4-like [Phymastichus coffea]|uniref:THO complex subunit 4-like n=1 Tax=Phymastichus coffea TaxID=108790 RepID=UPI00273BA3F9|nr:THO complex subunit 4-like [Phymastichus coffea]
MDMSLDDIIKQNKSKKIAQKGKHPGGGTHRAGKGGKGGSKGGKGGSPRRGPPSTQKNRKPGGGVLRGRSRGGISRTTASFAGRSLPPHKREAFLGSAPRRFGSSSEATKLIVSNLDYGVTDSDILELFSEFGPLKSAGVHYDRSGRSLGSADLIFERKSDAIKAMKQYNGVPLDGREMNIQLATSEIPTTTVSRSSSKFSRNFKKPASSGNRVNNKSTGGRPGGAGAGPKKGGRGGKAGGAGGRQKKAPPPTAEELDAQLEEYVKSKVTSSEGA